MSDVGEKARGMSLVAERPQTSPSGPYHFPSIDRWSTAGGDVVCADLPGRALASVSVLRPCGIALEPVERAGLTQLTARLLSEGTTARDAEAFSLAVEALGVSIGAHASWDNVTLTVGGPAGQIAQASELLAEAFYTPALRPDDTLRLRGERVEAQRMRWAQPGTRARAALRRELFGTASRYGWLDSGDQHTNAVIEPEDVVGLHAGWRSAPATLIVAGDLSRLDVSALAARLLGSADHQAVPPVTLRPVHEGGRRVLLVDRPGAAQSSLILGHAGPSRATPDFGALTTMCAVLGGSFNSRLNHQLREVKGYSYGAQAGFDHHRHVGSLRVTTEVRTDATVPALCDIVAEIERLHTEGLTAEEARDALAYQIGAFATTLETPNAIAGALQTIVTHGLPDDYYPQLRSELATLDKADLDRAAREYLTPEQLCIVVEGDLARFRDELAAAGLGPATELTTAELLSSPQ
jgi:predicted Zn-dependent peptidase